MIRMSNDLLMSTDSGLLAILVLLDLTATFDTISYDTLLPVSLKWATATQPLPGFIHISLVMPRTFNLRIFLLFQLQYGVRRALSFVTFYPLPLGNIPKKHHVSFHSTWITPNSTWPAIPTHFTFLDFIQDQILSSLNLRVTQKYILLVASKSFISKTDSFSLNPPHRLRVSESFLTVPFLLPHTLVRSHKLLFHQHNINHI